MVYDRRPDHQVPRKFVMSNAYLVQDFMVHTAHIEHVPSTWKIKIEDTPAQSNIWDCKLWVVEITKCTAFDMPLRFEERYMPGIR